MHFEALFTVDRSLPLQQNLRASGIAVVIAVARTNRVKELHPPTPAQATTEQGRASMARPAWRRDPAS